MRKASQKGGFFISELASATEKATEIKDGGYGYLISTYQREKFWLNGHKVNLLEPPGRN